MASENFAVDFIGIGAGKAGTTWVSECLTEHPQICLSRPKELNFFCRKTIWKDSVSNHDRGRSWFESKFQHWQNGQLRGEFSPTYMIDPDSPALIHHHNAQAKLIICLRNPVDRLYSLYYQLRKEYVVPGTFEEFLESSKDIIESSYYNTQLQRFMAYFSLSAMHFILFEDIRNNPADVMSGLYRFLQVDESFIASKLNAKVNERKEPRSNLIRNMISETKSFLNSNATLKKVKHVLASAGIESLTNKILELNLRNGVFPEINQETKKRLTDIYAPDIQELSKVLNRDLSLWTRS